jgi:hypothetical protein
MVLADSWDDDIIAGNEAKSSRREQDERSGGTRPKTGATSDANVHLGKRGMSARRLHRTRQLIVRAVKWKDQDHHAKRADNQTGGLVEDRHLPLRKCGVAREVEALRDSFDVLYEGQ